MPGLERREQQQRCQGGEEHRAIKGGKDSAGAALVEAQITEGAGAHFSKDMTANQVAGDDKKDVYASEAAREPTEARVMKDDAQDGYGAKPIDVGAVETAGCTGIGKAHAGRSCETTELQIAEGGTRSEAGDADGKRDEAEFSDHSTSNSAAYALARCLLAHVRLRA